MRTKAREDLEHDLRNPEFRKLYGAAEAQTELAVAIADARHDLGFIQKEMSQKMGVSQPYIAKLESGEANPTVGTIGSMLAILNLRLTMRTAPLLPTPSSAGSTATFVMDVTIDYKPAADTSENAMMPACPIGQKRKDTALFPIKNYDFLTPLDETDESPSPTIRSRSFEEANVGGPRA